MLRWRHWRPGCPMQWCHTRRLAHRLLGQKRTPRRWRGGQCGRWGPHHPGPGHSRSRRSPLVPAGHRSLSRPPVLRRCCRHWQGCCCPPAGLALLQSLARRMEARCCRQCSCPRWGREKGESRGGYGALSAIHYISHDCGPCQPTSQPLALALCLALGGTEIL
jgi:hypothetical protein